jgi:hypothetical protein
MFDTATTFKISFMKYIVKFTSQYMANCFLTRAICSSKQLTFKGLSKKADRKM